MKKKKIYKKQNLNSFELTSNHLYQYHFPYFYSQSEIKTSHHLDKQKKMKIVVHLSPSLHVNDVAK